MRAVTPYIDVPGDTPDRIMARTHDLVGMSDRLAVWRFGFIANSDFAKAFKCSITPQSEERYGFLWVLATRKTGKIKDTFRGYAMELPPQYRSVINWESKQ